MLEQWLPSFEILKTHLVTIVDELLGNLNKLLELLRHFGYGRKSECGGKRKVAGEWLAGVAVCGRRGFPPGHGTRCSLRRKRPPSTFYY